MPTSDELRALAGRVIVAPGIMVDPGIMGGVPCLIGERWPVSIASDYARRGVSVATLIATYEWLTVQQVADALAWQAQPLAQRQKRIKEACAHATGADHG